MDELPNPAYYAVNPQYNPTRPQITTLGDILSSISYMIGGYLAEQGAFTLAQLPALNYHQMKSAKLFSRIKYLNDWTIKTNVPKRAIDITPVTFTGKIKESTLQIMKEINKDLFNEQFTRANISKILAGFTKEKTGFIEATKNFLKGENFREFYRRFLTDTNVANAIRKRVFVGAATQGTLVAVWQRAQFIGMAVELGRFVFQGISALGQIRNEYEQAKTYSVLANTQGLIGIQPMPMAGEERYYMQQNISNHVLAQQLLNMPQFINPYSNYRLL